MMLVHFEFSSYWIFIGGGLLLKGIEWDIIKYGFGNGIQWFNYYK